MAALIASRPDWVVDVSLLPSKGKNPAVALKT